MTERHAAGRRLLVGLVGFAALLTLVSAIGRVVRGNAVETSDTDDRMAELFDVNLAANVPAFYAAGLLLVGAALALVLDSRPRSGASGGRGAFRQWLVISGLLVLACLEELAHVLTDLASAAPEDLGEPLGVTLVALGVLVAGAAIGMSALFVRRIGDPPRRWLILSGALYAVALLIEAAARGWLHAFDPPGEDVLKGVEQHVEELAEMAAAGIAVAALWVQLQLIGGDPSAEVPADA